ncbi:SHOCT domain-containing protein [Fodinibius halophilus]|uniref:SHOCT domain-containing protein n=1 Tax=Fodinibius halophilus TaxID=1736908 RepID=A0A6M1TJ94_9BACT|nr:SHOCT domain-containing protein [Fodinibius halophilus]NGP90132.1 SHOCT domain-containing protein [Fodinibius halophilus]
MFPNHHFIGMHWIWWLILAAAILLLFFDIIPHRSQSTPEEDALEILKRRYARGEIEREEYEERKAAITDNNH